jgi:hypothetical protein
MTTALSSVILESVALRALFWWFMLPVICCSSSSRCFVCKEVTGRQMECQDPDEPCILFLGLGLKFLDQN